MDKATKLIAIAISCCLVCQLVSSELTTKLFGNGSEYLFPCHCAENAKCNEQTGECPNGACETLLPDGYGWAGPACQEGNVAFLKPAESNTVVDEKNTKYNKPHLWHDADFLVDGSFEKNVFGGSCSVVYTDSKGELAWWMVDLEDIFTIINVTIVNTENSVDASYLETFDITVGNSSDRSTHNRCYRNARRITKSQHSVFQCDEFQVGRYVSIAKYQERNKVGRLPMCEVVIWGRKWLQVDWKWCADEIPNGLWCKSCYGDTSPTCQDAPCDNGNYGVHCSGTCGHCEDSAPCNPRTGHCERCAVGWKPPLGQEKCDPGTYGFHCLKSCGRCNGYCEVVNGTCPHGCQLWNIGDKCDVTIQTVNLDYVTQLYSLFEKATSVILHIPMPEVAMDSYHSVILEYIYEHDPFTAFRPYPYFNLHYSNITYWLKIEVNGLEPNTQYWFRVTVSRMQKNVTENGKPTPKLQVTTRPLADDDKTVVPPGNNVTINPTAAGLAAGQTTAQSNAGPMKVPYHLHLTALISSLVVVAIVLIAIPIIVWYLNTAKTGGFTVGRYVGTHEIENQFYTGQEERLDLCLDDGKAIGSEEFNKSTDNIYSVLSNNTQ